MNSAPSPFLCHIFVCTNDRHGSRKSCADGDNVAVREALKQAVADRGWKPRVRVSQCGCMGLCQDGPNVMIYPQGLCFHGVTRQDINTILEAVARQAG